MILKIFFTEQCTEMHVIIFNLNMLELQKITQYMRFSKSIYLEKH